MSADGTVQPSGGSVTATERRRFPIDAFDGVVFAVFTALSLWLLVLLALKGSPDHVWVGTDGPNAGDQMQYLGWIQQAAHHLLVANPFDTRPSPEVYFQPGLAVSGLLVRWGASPSMAYLFWKPAAVVAMFFGVRSYVRRILPGTAARRFALVLALFFISPMSEFVSPILSWLPAGVRYFVKPVVIEMWPTSYLWGYPFTALSIAAMLSALLVYERDRSAGRVRPWAPLLGLACAWLQPWQGATVLGVVVASELILRLTSRGQAVTMTQGWGLPVATVAATALPLAYYSVLSHIDSTWALAGSANFLVLPALSITAALIPLGLPSLLAYRYRPTSFQDVAVRTWPVVALLLYSFIAVAHVGTFPLHALQGLSIPFAILAVVGVQNLNLRLPSWAKIGGGMVLVALLIVPPVTQTLSAARSVGNSVFGPTPVFVTAGEWSALHYLKDDLQPGAVLAPVYLGQAVPGLTGRRTWVGIFSWTPHYVRRTQQADALLAGRLSPMESVDLIRSSGARFLLSDCSHHADLARLLPELVEPPTRFGCAAVYRVRPGPTG